jgi:hypothetical protein
VVGCKGDLESDRQVSDSEAADWAHRHKAEYILTSSKTAQNVSEAFVSLVHAWKRWKVEYELLLKATMSGKGAKDGSKRTACILQ